MPEVFRYLKQQGADFFALSAALPADIAANTWLPLLKARAIENHSFIFAANQCGFHEELGLLIHGHSSIINPLGQTVHCHDVGEKSITAQIDPKSFSNICFDHNPFQLQYRK